MLQILFNYELNFTFQIGGIAEACSFIEVGKPKQIKIIIFGQIKYLLIFFSELLEKRNNTQYSKNLGIQNFFLKSTLKYIRHRKVHLNS